MAPRIFIFSIVLGAEFLSYLKSIETHARAFSRLISDGISGVCQVRIDSFQENYFFNPLLLSTTSAWITVLDLRTRLNNSFHFDQRRSKKFIFTEDQVRNIV